MLKKLGVFKDFSDNSLKSVFESKNSQIIEMTLLFNKEEMDVVCTPTHHFCSLGCKMCHLTNKGLNKNMLAINTDDFTEGLVQTLSKYSNNGKFIKRTNKELLLISFMGVGEPLLNLKLIEEVYKREDYLKEILDYKKIGYAISTMMPNNNLDKLTEMVDRLNIPMKVHFSLHTPIDEARYDLIPSTNVSIDDALKKLITYKDKIQNNSLIIEKYTNFHRTNNPIEIHYTLINGVNDSDEELEILCNKLQKYQIPIKFIRFNPINELQVSNNEKNWIDTIHRRIPDLRVKTYSPPGREIGSSCGQFTKHYYHEEIETESALHEFEEWKKIHELIEE